MRVLRHTNIITALFRATSYARPVTGAITREKPETSLPFTSGWVEPHKIFPLLFAERSGSLPILQMLEEAGFADPLKEIEEARQHVSQLVGKFRPQSLIQKALLVFRSVLPTRNYIPFGEHKLYGLKETEGGLEVSYDPDQALEQRFESGLFLPFDIVADRSGQRGANGIEYGLLLTVLLRCAGIKAGIKIRKNSVYSVIAEVGSQRYKIDIEPTISFVPTEDQADPDSRVIAQYYIVRTVNLSQLDRAEEAMEAAKIAAEIEPRHSGAWDTLGSLYMDRKDYKEALRMFDQALEIDPNCENALLNCYEVFFRLNRYKEFMQAVERLLEVNPYNAIGWAGKIEMLMRKQDACPLC